MYELQEMIKTFERHAIESKELNKKLVKEYNEQNPGKEVPEYFEPSFCISTALGSICKEIDKLWIAIGGR